MFDRVKDQKSHVSEVYVALDLRKNVVQAVLLTSTNIAMFYTV